MIYFILLFLCVIACQVSKKKPKLQKILAFFFLIAMMLLVGLRDPSVGVDSERYADKLLFVREVSFSTYEPLFQLSINFVNDKWGTVLAWFMYLSLITYSLYTIAVLKYSQNPILTVLAFMVAFLSVFPDTMNNLRQGISMMFLLLSYFSAAEKKYLHTVILFILALGFHMSVLLVLPFYFISRVNFSKLTIAVVLSITFAFGIIGSSIFNISSLMSNISFLSEALMEGVDKLSGYTTSSAHILNWAGMITTMAPINILCYLLVPDNKDKDTYKYLYNFYFWGVVLGNIIMCSISFGARFVVLFIIVEAFLITFKYKTSQPVRLFFIFMVFYYCLSLIQIANSNEPGMIIPYKVNPELYRIL